MEDWLYPSYMFSDRLPRWAYPKSDRIQAIFYANHLYQFLAAFWGEP
jgi:hypothetical protein